MSQNKLLIQQVQSFIGGLQLNELEKLLKNVEQQIGAEIEIKEKMKGYKCYEANIVHKQIQGGGFGRDVKEAKTNALRCFFDNMVQFQDFLEIVRKGMRHLKEGEKNNQQQQQQKIQQKLTQRKESSNNVSKDVNQMKESDFDFEQNRNQQRNQNLDQNQCFDENNNNKNIDQNNNKEKKQNNYMGANLGQADQSITLQQITEDNDQQELEFNEEIDMLQKNIGNISVIQNNNPTNITVQDQEQSLINIINDNDYNQQQKNSQFNQNQNNQQNCTKNNKSNNNNNLFFKNQQLAKQLHEINQNLVHFQIEELDEEYQSQQEVSQNLMSKFQQVQVNTDQNVEKIINSHKNNQQQQQQDFNFDILESQLNFNKWSSNQKANEGQSRCNSQRKQQQQLNLQQQQQQKENYCNFKNKSCNNSRVLGQNINLENQQNNQKNSSQGHFSQKGSCCRHEDELKREKQKVQNLEKRLQLILEENQILKSMISSKPSFNNTMRQQQQSIYVKEDKENDKNLQKQIEVQLNAINTVQTQNSISKQSGNKNQRKVLTECSNQGKQKRSMTANNNYSNNYSNQYNSTTTSNNNFKRLKEDLDQLFGNQTNKNFGNNSGISQNINHFNSSTNYSSINNASNNKKVPKLNLKVLPNYHGKNRAPVNNQLLHYYQKGQVQ
ncbi:hypothetical protein PPERSA_00523 [Pseudocohnilembus persalinus]|uniref:Uncharacterized protein n=1 Tax=Pseudocohnilembus persalinus TaxID=266149 RepID=A0A0V0QIG0_PSEPJ|nr:hypothetical protein PPERSA_00523 [Pseudocohnilembus persalinus]|eukprot:KRX01813.1 hypothetical protein PPERSA_00523 [Pseudocohnilembus persalinus]